MTRYFAELIDSLSSENNSHKDKAHYLFLLGTNVNFVEKPNVKPYSRGETLSYLAQLMSQLQEEIASVVIHADATNTASLDYAHPYHSNSVDVVNGADLIGYEIGDRIAKGLLLALNAVAAGKKELVVSGFSRGGVEAIVLMHELARVRDALKADLALEPAKRRSLSIIISDSNAAPGMAVIRDRSYTRAALAVLTASPAVPEDAALKQRLLTNLEVMQAKLFVLDPVPGGDYSLVRLGWQEAAFYAPLPSFVVKKLEIVQKHETSYCFMPIIPQGMPYEIIPGSHGTGDGNQFADNGTAVPLVNAIPNRDLSGAQNLVLRRWFDLMLSNVARETNVNLGHADLDAVTNSYLSADEDSRSRQLLSNYEAIQKNYPAFEWLATVNYTACRRGTEYRQIHYQNGNSTPVTDLDAHADGTFINLQHVQLWMATSLKNFNFFEKSLVEQVQWINENINNAFQSETSPKETEAWMVNKLLENEKNHTLVHESLSYLVSTVTQSYMRNHLMPTDGLACQNCVDNAFKTLEAAANSEKLPAKRRELAKSVETAIRLNLSNTLVRHQRAIFSLGEKLLNENTLEKASEQTLAWLIEIQKTHEQLGALIQHMSDLQPWTDQDYLKKAWIHMLPNYAAEGFETLDFPAAHNKLTHFIHQQQALMLFSAIEVLSRLPEALQQKPEGLADPFYTLIRNKANAQNLADSVQQLRAQVETSASCQQKLETDLQALAIEKQQLQTTNQQLTAEMQQLEKDKQHSLEVGQALGNDKDNLTKEKQQLEEEYQGAQLANQKLALENQQLTCSNQLLITEKEQLKTEVQQAVGDSKRVEAEKQKIATVNQELDAKIKKLEGNKYEVCIQQLESKIKLLEAFRTPEQETALIKISELIIRSQNYLKHLKGSKDKSTLLQTKLDAIEAMLGKLQNHTELPTLRLATFKQDLNSAQDSLKTHRNPSWQRFFRDCLHILGFTMECFQYLGSTKDERPQFFKPSHGELFVNEGLRDLAVLGI